ncbi:hypothetical protein J7M23_12605 [Candidatus Sumerlaeota bacterium]|nr:hypothetical protein [Candidatus Sumerlaeota bacterium]
MRQVLLRQADNYLPIDLGPPVSSMTITGYRRLKQYLGLEDHPSEVIALDNVILRFHPKIMEEFGIDFIRIFSKPGRKGAILQELPDGTIVDEWGRHRKLYIDYLEFVDFPLKEATITELESYPWPDPNDPERVKGLEEEARYLYENTDYVLVADTIGGIFETSWQLRGLENFLIDLKVNPEFALALMEKVTDYFVQFYPHYLNAIGKYVDVVVILDDFGSQRDLMLSPEVVVKYILPFEQRLIETIHRYTSALVMFHSCGSVYRIIPELIKIGVDILNPIQVSAEMMNDTRRLKQEYGEVLTFWGAIDAQHVLPFGTREDVRREVQRRIQDLSPGGGYVLASSHNIQPETPPENIVEMFTTAKRLRERKLSKGI